MPEKKIDLPNYEVIVSVKNKKYFCRIPELSLFGKGNDLESSYQELMKKKEEFIKEIEEYQSEDDFIPPSTTWFREDRGQLGPSITKYGLTDFLIKAGIVGVMILIIVTIASNTIGGGIRNVINSSLTMVDRQIESTLSASSKRVEGGLVRMGGNIRSEIKNELYKAVDHPIDAEREEKIIKNIRVVVNRWKPFVKELRPLLEELGMAEKKN